MITKETAKQFLEINGYPNPDDNFEEELIDTMVGYALQQVENNDCLYNIIEQIKTEKININNLEALIQDRDLNLYQIGLALAEYNKLTYLVKQIKRKLTKQYKMLS